MRIANIPEQVFEDLCLHYQGGQEHLISMNGKIFLVRVLQVNDDLVPLALNSGEGEEEASLVLPLAYLSDGTREECEDILVAGKVMCMYAEELENGSWELAISGIHPSAECGIGVFEVRSSIIQLYFRKLKEVHAEQNVEVHHSAW